MITPSGSALFSSRGQFPGCLSSSPSLKVSLLVAWVKGGGLWIPSLHCQLPPSQRPGLPSASVHRSWIGPAQTCRPSLLGGAGAEGRAARPNEEGRLQVNPQHRAECAFSLCPHFPETATWWYKSRLGRRHPVASRGPGDMPSRPPAACALIWHSPPLSAGCLLRTPAPRAPGFLPSCSRTRRKCWRARGPGADLSR